MKKLWENTVVPIGHLKGFVPYLRPYRLHLCVVAVIGIIVSTVPLVFPHLLRMIIDVAYPVRDLRLFWKISLGMVALMIFVAAVRGYGDYLSTYMNLHVGRRIQADIFEKMNHLQMSYLESTGPNALVERMSFDSQEIAKTLLATVTDVASIPVLFIATFVLMTRISITFTLIVLVVIPFYYAVTIVATSILRKLQHRYRRQIEKVKNVIDASFHGIDVLKVFRRQQVLQQRAYEKALGEMISLEMLSWRYSFIYGRLSELMTAGWGFVLTLGGLFLMFKGKLQMGEAMALGMYVVVLMRPFGKILALFRGLVSASVAAQRIVEMDRYRTKSVSHASGGAPDASDGIAIQELSFSYVPGELVLNDISLSIPAGNVLAIIGANGSGKTTLLKLIANYYAQYTGRILVGRTELRDVDDDRYAQLLATVWAENHFFDRTILENCLADDRSDESEIQRLAEVLGFDSWIRRLDLGYDTVLGVNGTKLSSGESHKIALLRALAKRPSILLIDEFSSCLDVESEHALLQGLASLRPEDSITVLVTHKVEVAMQPWVRQLVVLSQGRLVQHGPSEQFVDLAGDGCGLAHS